MEMKALRKAVQGHEGHGLPDDKKAAKKALMAEVHHHPCTCPCVCIGPTKSTVPAAIGACGGGLGSIFDGRIARRLSALVASCVNLQTHD